MCTCAPKPRAGELPDDKHAATRRVLSIAARNLALAYERSRQPVTQHASLLPYCWSFPVFEQHKREQSEDAGYDGLSLIFRRVMKHSARAERVALRDTSRRLRALYDKVEFEEFGLREFHHGR